MFGHQIKPVSPLLKIKRWSALALGIGLISLSFSSWSVDKKISVVTEVLQPYQYLDSNDSPKGYGVDVLNSLLSRMDYQAEYEFLPWLRAYKKALKTTDTIILAIGRTEEREDKFHWIGELHKETFSFYALKSNSNVTEINDLEDIRKHSIIVTKDSVLDHYVTEKSLPNVERSIDVEQTYRMLYRNRVDLVFKSHTSIKTQTNNFGYSYEELAEVFRVPDLSINLYIAINQSSDPKLIKALKDEFELMKTNGQFQAIKKRWQIQ